MTTTFLCLLLLLLCAWFFWVRTRVLAQTDGITWVLVEGLRVERKAIPALGSERPEQRAGGFG